jgi:hypothetical protein
MEIAASWVDGHACRLVDNDHIVIFVNNPDR